MIWYSLINDHVTYHVIIHHHHLYTFYYYHHHLLPKICMRGSYHYHFLIHLHINTILHHTNACIICLLPPQHTHIICHDHTITILWNIHHMEYSHILSSRHKTTIGSNNKRSLSTSDSQQLFYLKFYLLLMIVWQMMSKRVLQV